ncbi:pyridoxal phosphate-dependent aminotransferase [Corynebacterium halotolerans]|uniref:Aminotransferase n=1 Tax=Corynebacterium halotolerans YIM 70093 = DSM 44683 TaxID=1121362 RepID=M1NK71_9CORY|nr:pyridoxal phosphate-dependent aminotransferase [Corynebacterium halotolerans]AGF71813.1 aminotransferase [Corynebacterium halotolerans YIM 70093 = DSM 44683]
MSPDSRVVTRLQPFAETVFATMTAKAVEHGAINLGQGFPDSDGPARMLEIACEQIRGGNNQYGPGRGMAVLREAVATRRHRDHGVTYDPETEVLVTVGATEAISATVLGLVEPGAEVIVLEPYYDAYAAAIALAGARRVAVPLVSDGDSWAVDVDAVRAAVTEKTAMIIVNSPHNPTGAVFSRESLLSLAELCAEADLTVLSDEVYENLVFDGRSHTALASLPDMFERTVTVSSAAKSYNVTGWKTGWALAPAPLLDAVLKAKQFMSYVGATPFQPAVAHALEHEDAWLREMVTALADGRDLLGDALREAGLKVHGTAGTYFTVADISPLGYPDGVEFCLDLPAKIGVAAIPVQVFCDEPGPWRTKVRFAFCKREDTLREAARRLSRLRSAS